MDLSTFRISRGVGLDCLETFDCLEKKLTTKFSRKARRAQRKLAWIYRHSRAVEEVGLDCLGKNLTTKFTRKALRARRKNKH